jgi:hypothetical protein
MRKEISGQVRRTFGGNQRAGSSDVWDTATNEIPPEVGESPECQWCPICRAARRMRDSGPGLGGHLSGAGDAVASAVQDAVSALDSILGKPGGSGAPRGDGTTRASAPPRSAPGSASPGSAGPGSASPGSASPGSASPGSSRAGSSRAGSSRAGSSRPGTTRSGTTRSGTTRAGSTSSPAGTPEAGPGAGASAAGDHGPGGWKPGDRLATSETIDPDPWAEATDADEAGSVSSSDQRQSEPGQVAESGQGDGLGHGSDDRS